jgi:hypothetical protein
MAKKQGKPRYCDGRELGKPRQPSPTPAQLNAAAREYWSDEPGRAEARLMDVQRVAEFAATALPALRKQWKEREDRARPRRSRMPALDAWLDETDLTATNDALFEALPDEAMGADLYRDGAHVVEISRDGKEHSITRAGFNKRVTQARKRKRDVRA